METHIQIRFGELSTKGKNKKRFVQQLAQNVRMVTKDHPQIKIKPEHDFMLLELNGADESVIIDRLQHVFGIQNYSPVYLVSRDLNEVKRVLVELLAKMETAGKTFKIATRRSDHDYEHDTTFMNAELGATVLDAFPGISVKMKQPDILVRVDIKTSGIMLSTQPYQGAGGLPVGSSGRGMLMLSGGIDSPVAGYLAMKRGVKIEAVHFHSPPYTSPQALQKAKDLAAKLTKFGGEIQFIEVPFTEIQEEIKEKVPADYLMTITRRMMLRITDAIRAERKGLAIFNGESLAQVASQTLESMVAINDVTTTPIIRPVATMDKLEIIALAQRIDTFDLSVQPFEDCCTIFAPPAPKTKPHLDKARRFEALLDVEPLVMRAVEGIVVSSITGREDTSSQDEALFSDLL